VRLFSSGLHTLRAIYDGDARCAGSGATCTLTVVEPASVAIAAHQPSGPGEWLRVIARVHGRWDGPACTGSVLFECDGLPLGSEEIHDGQAVITRVLAPGPHSLTATYAGDSRHAGARSAALEIEA
jgi:Bacterial Ig-like domain (group 3)